jgi:hypothetical protein
MLSHDVVPHDARPDQVFGPQQLKCSRHLARLKISLAPHEIFEKVNLTLIDENSKFSGLGEIHLRGEQT